MSTERLAGEPRRVLIGRKGPMRANIENTISGASVRAYSVEPYGERERERKKKERKRKRRERERERERHKRQHSTSIRIVACFNFFTPLWTRRLLFTSRPSPRFRSILFQRNEIPRRLLPRCRFPLSLSLSRPPSATPFHSLVNFPLERRTFSNNDTRERAEKKSRGNHADEAHTFDSVQRFAHAAAGLF